MSGEQRRLAAIVFTDIEGYTAMAQKNEGLAMELVQEQVRLLRPIFSKFDGREIKTVGDAFLVEFPSALQASNCAVEIQTALRTRNSEVPAERKIPLRIGIHVGDVIVRGGDIFGDAVNIASRIEPLAESGGISISQQVYDQIYNKTERKLESIGKHELKNVEAPVQVYKIVMPWDEVPVGEQKRVLPLIDRQEEMGALRTAFDKAAQGNGGLVFIVGEAGIGKTRLADELTGHARKKGFTVMTGRCHRREGNAPYTPWAELTRNFVRGSSPRDLVRLVGSQGSELAKLVPEISEKIGPVTVAPAGVAEQDRIRFFDGITQAIKNVSKETPVLLILEDLNWADVASLDLLQYFARNTKGGSVMTLGTYRDVELEEESPLAEVLYELNREKLMESVRLKGLSPEDVSKMVKEYFGAGQQVSDEFRDLIHRKTGGNPFFIEEVLRSFVEQGVVYRTKEGWERKAISEIQIPSGVKMVIKQRLSHLDQDCLSVLSVASVTSCAAKDFGFDLLQKVTGMEEERLLDLMDKILKSKLIGETQLQAGRSAYEFTDLRIRDALYEEMSLVRRSRYHLKTGQAIEEIYGGRMSDAYGVLAFHYLKGNENAKCLSFSLKAAEEAERLYAHREAIKYYQIALDLLEGSGDRGTTAMVLGQLGDSYWFSGSTQLCLTSYEKAARLYEELGDKRKAARIYTEMGHRAYDAARNDSATPRRHYDTALALLDGEGEVEELAWLYQNMARFDWLSGNFAESDVFSRKALALAEKLGLHDVEAHTYLDMAVIAPPAEKERKHQNMQRALQIGLEHDYLEVVLRAYNNLSVEATGEEAFEYASKGLEYARRVGYIGWQPNFQSAIGDHYRNIGELQKAEEIGKQLLESAGTRAEGERWAYPLLGGVYLLKGDLEQSEKYLKLAHSRVEGTTDFQSAIFFEFGLGVVNYEKGDLSTADRHLTKAWTDSVALGLTGMGTYLLSVVQMLSSLIQLELKEGKLESAKSHLEELKKLCSQTNDERVAAGEHDSVGRVLAAEGDFKSSAEELRKVLESYRKERDVYGVIRTLYKLGSVYQKGGDPENASKSFEEVLETSRRIGSTLYVDRTLAKMGRK